MAQQTNVYHHGLIHVCSKLCDTCIYRPGSPLEDTPIKAAAVKAQTAVICHATLPFKEQAICRGFFNATPTLPLQLAVTLGCIKFVPPPPKDK